MTLVALEDKTLVFDFGVYHGEVHPASGLRHGFGVLKYNSGNTYEGQWEDGAPHGEGIKRYHNGDYYNGQWVSGKRQGAGEYHFVQGDIYRGEYFNDVSHGHGRLVTRNGDVYEGHWESGKQHGDGTEKLAVGNTFVGSWVRGKKSGQGSLTTPTERIVGIWQSDKLIEVLTRQEMEYQPQVRSMVNSAMSTVTNESELSATDPDAIPLSQNAIEDMRRAGADEELIRALTSFSEQMSDRMGSVLGGIGSIEGQLNALTTTLGHLAGLDDDMDEAVLKELGGIEGVDGEYDDYRTPVEEEEEVDEASSHDRE